MDFAKHIPNILKGMLRLFERGKNDTFSLSTKIPLERL